MVGSIPIRIPKEEVYFSIIFIGGLVSKFKVSEIADHDIVDTNGAGDAFIGAMTTSYHNIRSNLHHKTTWDDKRR